MSFRHKVDFTCDNCDKEYMLSDGMELPPSWIGVQIAIANTEGMIPEHEQEVYLHFCSIECLSDYVKGNDMMDRFLLADRPVEDEDDDDNNGNQESGPPDEPEEDAT
jgi:hypothetical protein